MTCAIHHGTGYGCRHCAARAKAIKEKAAKEAGLRNDLRKALLEQLGSEEAVEEYLRVAAKALRSIPGAGPQDIKRIIELLEEL